MFFNFTFRNLTPYVTGMLYYVEKITCRHSIQVIGIQQNRACLNVVFLNTRKIRLLFLRQGSDSLW